MDLLHQTEVERGAGNNVYEFTRDDDLFVVNALKLASITYSERARAALHEEGKSVDDPDVRTLFQLSQEYGSRAGYIGMPLESSDYENLDQILYKRTRGEIETSAPWTPGVQSS